MNPSYYREANVKKVFSLGLILENQTFTVVQDGEQETSLEFLKLVIISNNSFLCRTRSWMFANNGTTFQKRRQETTCSHAIRSRGRVGFPIDSFHSCKK